MAKILDMPKLSPTMEEGVLATWHKKEGDSVNVDDLLAEVETDKATMEFRAFDKGTLLKILVEPGATVKLGQPVAILGSEGEDVSALVAEAGGGGGAAKEEEAPISSAKKKEKRAEPEEEAAKPKPKAAPTLRPPPAPKRTGSVLTRTEDAGEDAPAPGGERVLASPYVRKVARERGIDLSAAKGSGEHGRIVPADLEGMKSGGPAPAAAPSAALAKVGLAEPEVRPLSPMRKTIARRLTQSKQTVPHFYLTIDVEVSELVKLRESINQDLAANMKPAKKDDPNPPKPEKVSLNDLVIKAAAAALVRVPECNAQYTDDAILIHKRVDVSVAVAIPDGLVTPVVRNADQKSVVGIAREVRDLAARARTKKLKPEEMSDGTFSISNLGMFGIDEFSAVINPPEGAILAVGQARAEPVVKDGAVVPGKKMAMTLSCDHRVVDGAVGAAFLAELRDLLEHPMRILTG
ncbi:MAG: pyruvate dehydrogenase complex dihydrolipoamide acetyltransferase [Labilithrix sp.]|nr:pyruvate dehydrogenase complex dihydrolipoamide acetyltransferase [Labilithrix sp.]MCW5814655.1 pyruvate dehydrogenase complex dihydrolipoamide acetyltransferase [Labilithrix sp.]